MYPRKKGFTLLEVLIVMVIIASLFSFAFPAYKKAQDRNKYLNARGVLEDLGFAVRELQANLTQADPSRAFPDTSAVLLERAYQNTASSSYTTAAATNLQDLAGADLPYALFAQTYMQPIMFDGTTGNEVNAYLFYICPQNTASSSYCCGNDDEVVACMYDADAATTRPAGGLYYGARVYRDGTVEQLSI